MDFKEIFFNAVKANQKVYTGASLYAQKTVLQGLIVHIYTLIDKIDKDIAEHEKNLTK